MFLHLRGPVRVEPFNRVTFSTHGAPDHTQYLSSKVLFPWGVSKYMHCDVRVVVSSKFM